MDDDVTSRLKDAAGAKSGADLARLLGIPESTARAYLNGTRNPSREACEEIGPMLGVSGRWLFDGTGPRDQMTPHRHGWGKRPQPYRDPSRDVWAAVIAEAISEFSESPDGFGPLSTAVPKIVQAILATAYETPLEVGQLTQVEIVRPLVRTAMRKLRTTRGE